VLIAKSTYVWLAQMSRQYGRTIARLDEIPDEELATLARRGSEFAVADRRLGAQPRLEDDQAALRQLTTPWPRPTRSSTIAIAEDLGGEAAYTNLRDRAYRHGIRLASDMVPNHMGIDSPWVDRAPGVVHERGRSRRIPAYSFNGPDLSQ
jgi:hypothetical protein